MYRWLPIVIIALITPFSARWDLEASRYFFQNGAFVSNSLTEFIFEYGVIPGDVAVGIALVVFLLSFLVVSLKRWRSLSLALILTMAIGAGLITHALLKDHWGRPRPKQVEEFGGMQQFRPYYSPNFFNQPESSKSFPCGHSSTGFVFFALALAGKRMGSQNIYVWGMILAIGLGGALGLCRMAQGGHFLMDVLMSACIMWFTSIGCVKLAFHSSFISHPMLPNSSEE